MPADFALCVDLGGTFIKGAVVTKDGAIQKQVKHPTRSGEGQAAVLEAIMDVIRDLGPDAAEVAGIGIGVPGHADTVSGVTSSIFNIPELNGVHLRRALEDQFSLPVMIDNDATNAAAGEFYFGAGKGSRHMMCVTLGTGIGAGLVLNGQVFRGASDYAGEFGHMTAVQGGRQCSCGSFGCVEAYSSGTGITALAKLARERNPDSKLLEHAASAITPLLVKQLADAGDTVCLSIFRQAGQILGTVLASAVNLLNLELCIIGGGVSAAGAMLMEPIEEAFRMSVMPHAGKVCRLLPAALGNDAGVLGCAALVFLEDINRLKS